MASQIVQLRFELPEPAPDWMEELLASEEVQPAEQQEAAA